MWKGRNEGKKERRKAVGCSFTVAEWLTHSIATPEVTGFTPQLATFLRFISQIDTVSVTEGLKMVCVALW